MSAPLGEPAAPPIPEWFAVVADQFMRRYTRRVSPLGLMCGAYLAGWEAAHREPASEPSERLVDGTVPA